MSQKLLCEDTFFNYETTQRSDYREKKPVPTIKPTYQTRPKKPREEFKPVKFVGTMVDWKEPVPFDALWVPKDIIRTNPKIPQQPYEKLKDLDREKVQKTRPRLVIAPGILVDDIEDQKLRDIIINSTYTSEYSAKSKEAVSSLCNVTAPIPELPTNSNPIKLPPWKLPAVPEEWRMESLFWDNRQIRGGIDANKEFWLRFSKNKSL